MDLGSLQNKFITQDSLEEKRQKRQEEWEKVRKANDPVEAPEEVVDNRSLYEQLQAQKQKKDDDYEEQHRLRNQVRGLDEDESKFLDFVSDRQEELLRNRDKEDEQVLNEYRVVMESQVKKLDEKTVKPAAVSRTKFGSESKPRRSQQALLGVAVKRKSTDAKPDDSSSKRAASNSTLINAPVSITPEKTQLVTQGPSARIIGILPGLGDYSVSSDSVDSSDDSSSGDSDMGLGLMSRPKKMAVAAQQQQTHAQ